MPIGPLRAMLSRLNAAFSCSGLSDDDLLQRFIRTRDDAAFSAIVRRHGPMVLGVCRRVLAHAQDAEDAFQATFLVISLKAASLAHPKLLGNWLYGVAYRAALEAKRARRRRKERQVSAMPEIEVAESQDLSRDVKPLLDSELSRLSEKHRTAVILCDLEGRSLRDAARSLGIPEGTLSGRLTTARRKLAVRLARRGVTLTPGAL